MLNKWVKRVIALALIAAPVSAFADHQVVTAREPAPQYVTVNAGQMGFITVPVLQTPVRPYALTGDRSPVQVIYYRFGQGEMINFVEK